MDRGLVLVTGAGGFVGGHFVRRVAERGRVRALVRRSDARLPTGVEHAVGDLTDPESLAPALEGVAIVVHAAAITADHKEPYPGAYERVNGAGTENLVAAARKAGVKRLVVMSGLGTQPAPPDTYMATRWRLEEAVRQSGIPFVILQPSVLFGDGAAFVTALADLIRRFPAVPALGRPDLLFQPLWIGDLTRCLDQAGGDDSVLGRAIALGGAEQLTFRAILETIAEAEKRKRLILPLPLGVARLQARLMTAVLPRPPLTPAALELFAFDNATALDAVDRAFGFHPRGFREHLQAHGLD